MLVFGCLLQLCTHPCSAVSRSKSGDQPKIVRERKRRGAIGVGGSRAGWGVDKTTAVHAGTAVHVGAWGGGGGATHLMGMRPIPFLPFSKAKPRGRGSATGLLYQLLLRL
jgi:hypothetical protein